MKTPLHTRIQQALDGALPKEALTPGERHKLAALEAAIVNALGSLPQDQVPDLAPVVLARIANRPRPVTATASAPADVRPGQDPAVTRAWRAALNWLWAPRPVALVWRPAYGLAVAGLAVVAGAVVPWGGAPPLPAAVPAERVLVQFRLDAPGAREVALAGDFTDWEPSYVLQHSGRGVWTVVAPLAPGVHSYAFVINGERWVPDPMAPAIEDGFGGLNSRVAIITPDRPEQAS